MPSKMISSSHHQHHHRRRRRHQFQMIQHHHRTPTKTNRPNSSLLLSDCSNSFGFPSPASPKRCTCQGQHRKARMIIVLLKVSVFQRKERILYLCLNISKSNALRFVLEKLSQQVTKKRSDQTLMSKLLKKKCLEKRYVYKINGRQQQTYKNDNPKTNIFCVFDNTYFLSIYASNVQKKDKNSDAN